MLVERKKKERKREGYAEICVKNDPVNGSVPKHVLASFQSRTDESRGLEGKFEEN